MNRSFTKWALLVATLFSLLFATLSAPAVGAQENRIGGTIIGDNVPCYEKQLSEPYAWLAYGTLVTIFPDLSSESWKAIGIDDGLGGQATCSVYKDNISPGEGGLVDEGVSGTINPGGDKSDESPVQSVEDPPPSDPFAGCYVGSPDVCPDKGVYTDRIGMAVINDPDGARCRWTPDWDSDTRTYLEEGTAVIEYADGNQDGWQYVIVPSQGDIGCYVRWWLLDS